MSARRSTEPAPAEAEEIPPEPAAAEPPARWRALRRVRWQRGVDEGFAGPGEIIEGQPDDPDAVEPV